MPWAHTLKFEWEACHGRIGLILDARFTCLLYNKWRFGRESTLSWEHGQTWFASTSALYKTARTAVWYICMARLSICSQVNHRVSMSATINLSAERRLCADASWQVSNEFRAEAVFQTREWECRPFRLARLTSSKPASLVVLPWFLVRRGPAGITPCFVDWGVCDDMYIYLLTRSPWRLYSCRL